MLRFNLSNKTLQEKYFVLKKKPWFIRSYKALLTEHGAIVRSRFLFEPNAGFVWLVSKKDMYEFLGLGTAEADEIREVWEEEVNRIDCMPIDYNEREMFSVVM